jgi:hypothetical protein
MTEPTPSYTQDRREPIPVPHRGANIRSTLDMPPDPKGIKAFMAHVRKDVLLARRRRPQTGS